MEEIEDVPMPRSMIRRADPYSRPDVVIPGNDPFAPHLLLDYAARCQETGRLAAADQARSDARVLREWQTLNPLKADPAEG